ncbi:MAG: hypothetical protein GC184_04910 [Rhizobiales bacterium]|nr:hypothetical protein [Hyphomicrobiales bacterium]
MTSSNQAVARSTSSEALSLLASSVRKPTTSVDESGFASLLYSSTASEPAPEPRRREDRSSEARANERQDDRTRSQSKRTDETRATDNHEAAREKPTDPKVTDNDQVASPGAPADEAVEGDAGTASVSDEKAAKTDHTDAKKTAAADKASDAGKAAEAKADDATPEVAAGDAQPQTVETDMNKAAIEEVAGDTKPTDKKAAAKSDDTAAATVIPVATPLATTKPVSLKTDKISLDSKSSDKQASPPASDKLPGQTAATPAAAAAADDATPAPATGAAGDDVESASGAPIKSLGHETAKAMADAKTEIRDAAKATAPQPVAGQVQTAAQNTRAAAPTTQTFTPVDAAGGDNTQTTNNGQLLSTSATSTSNAATIRIGTLPGQSQPTQVPAMAIALQMSRNLQRGSSSFEIRLDPAELGRVDVRMEVRKDGHVTAHLTIDKPETLDLLQRDARALQQALNDAGLQADSDSLNFSLRDQSTGGNGSQNASANSQTGFGNDMGVDGSDPAAAQPSLYNVNLSATGGIDIRI